ncbi:HAD-IC family P-type ATPase [Kutzneria sp. CA-103260]|uniref:HAD-IC family P-type ATPase n=1 Tax=Kutzneria sp. CA-103260 TaxID=2802641 RepID=UPI001BEEB215|nr:HAD-IC family P-type ATPase [Kutzneria sp. CA-103260]QUQ71828.1 magnesium-translocating P-type ATPase [Kutzneria sp. CA-103260]
MTRTTQAVAATLTELSAMDAAMLIRHLGASPAGLTTLERNARLARHGRNEVAGRSPHWTARLLRGLRSPFVGLLLGLDLVLALTANYAGAVTVGVMVLVSVLLRITQEYRSDRAAKRLRDLVATTAVVAKRGTGSPRRFTEPAAAALGAVTAEVPVEELVPGDVVHLKAGDLVPADCRLLTANNLVVEQATLSGESLPVRKTVTTDRIAGNVLDSPVFCFLGSTVVGGSATAVVVGTGRCTYLGAIASRLTDHDRDTDAGMRSVSWTLIRFTLVLAPIVLLVSGLTHGDWTEAALLAVSVAVGLTPEMLPVIVAANLAKGASDLARQQVIVKRLRAVHEFGQLDVLCVDKTGTLTDDRIVLADHTDNRTLELAYVNAALQTGLRNPFDRAVIDAVEPDHRLILEAGWRLVDELPFDHERRRMSVVVRDTEGRHLLVTKGAVEHDEAANGTRVLGVWCKEVDARHIYQLADEDGADLVGHLFFQDPPKESAAQAVKQLRELGIEIVVVTGDNERVAGKVCRDIGIPDATVHARATPARKAEIVRELREAGHTVGFLGDGVNDAAALREADLAISVGGALPVARDTAEVILLRKDLTVLAGGVLAGRRTFANTMKYVKLTASSNFGNVLSVLAAAVLLPFLPMLPVQLLVQNLMYDIAQLAIPWDGVDREQVSSPRKWAGGDLARFMLLVGPLSSVFDLALFAAMGHFDPATFQTGWFVEGLLSQLLIVHVIRTQRLRSRASLPVLAATAVVAAIGLALPFTGLFGLVALPTGYFPWLAAVLVGYCALVQAVKSRYVRKFATWL